MNPIEKIHSTLKHIAVPFVAQLATVPSWEVALNTDSKKQQFGDITTNIAMVIARATKQNPRQCAQEIVETLSGHSDTQNLIEKIEIAGPGFINIFLTQDAYTRLIQDLYTHKDAFFVPEKKPTTRYNIEFVSANPTGPLHLGHGRGGIIGDVLSNVLHFLGYPVITEYYINDAGAQITKLGNSFKIRCLQELGKTIELPEDSYRGEYLVQLAQQAVQEFGADLESKPNQFFADYAKEHMLNALKKTLENYGITFDVWFSEKTLHTSGAIEQALTFLANNSQTYEQDSATWFKSTAYGDDKDRVLKKKDGTLTYVSADIAYLKNKKEREFDKLVMILGQDHHSYVQRLKGAMQALNYNPDDLNVILYQLVTLKQSGDLVRMSKRAGTMISLQDVIDTVGTDVARFFYLNRKADAHLDFDIDLALKKTEENPVYYIQYALVRIKSILNKAQGYLNENPIDTTKLAELDTAEKLLLKKIASLKNLLHDIAQNYQTHLLTYYVLELAQLFHGFYGKHKVLDPENIEQTNTRLTLVTITKNTLELCLKLLGISCPDSM